MLRKILALLILAVVCFGCIDFAEARGAAVARGREEWVDLVITDPKTGKVIGRKRTKVYEHEENPSITYRRDAETARRQSQDERAWSREYRGWLKDVVNLGIRVYRTKR